METGTQDLHDVEWSNFHDQPISNTRLLIFMDGSTILPKTRPSAQPLQVAGTDGGVAYADGLILG